MKNLLIISILFTFTTLSFSQTKISFNDYEAVGIGTINPPFKLTIEGTGEGGTPDNRTFLSLYNKTESSASTVNMRFQVGYSNSFTMLNQHSSNYGYEYYGNTYSDFGQLWNSGAGLILRAGSNNNPNGIIKFQTGLAQYGASFERMRINYDGNIGIGTTNPRTKLQITEGDVYIENASKGIILKSPAGNCFRVTVDDFGNLIRAQIYCP